MKLGFTNIRFEKHISLILTVLSLHFKKSFCDSKYTMTLAFTFFHMYLFIIQNLN